MPPQEYAVFNAGDAQVVVPQKRGMGCWTVGCLGFSFLLLLCCGGLGVGGYFMFSRMKAEAIAVINKDPVVQEQLGEVKDLSVDLKALRDREPGDNDPLDVQVVGTKSNGTITVHPRSFEEEILIGTLTMPDGTEFQLGPPPDEPVDMDDDAADDVPQDDPFDNPPPDAEPGPFDDAPPSDLPPAEAPPAEAPAADETPRAAPAEGDPFALPR